MPLIPKFITGIATGLTKNKKPFLIPDQAWQTLENAIVYRERVLKRKGVKFIGRLRRDLAGGALGITPVGPTFINFPNLLTTAGVAGEPNAQIQPGFLMITIVAPDAATFTDNGDGTFAVTGAGVSAGSFVNYATGEVNLVFSGALVGGAAITATVLNYFPGLPVMGIPLREIAAINDEETIWFDTKYAYKWNGTFFDEVLTGTTWASTDSDFFQAFNYRGAAPQDRLFFETNFINTAANPMRYYDGATWTTFAPLVAAADTLFTCRILVAYYGRLLALNCWEGATAAGPAAAVNISNRCRFSQIGSPIQADAFQTDIFGKGGLIDAPTNEAIIGAMFDKNTLVVTFEQTTWQLRYVGEYGLPFIWERVSSDYGSESTFSTVLFENYMLAVGDKAVIAANGIGVDRIDLEIPDQVFEIQNKENGVKRVHGQRDYKNEFIYWCFPDSNTQAAPGVNTKFPNRVLIYNYRNKTWGVFRDNVTAFGLFQITPGVTWDDLTVTWDDEFVLWDSGANQTLFPAIVAGNQQGYVFLYNWQTPDEKTLTIQDINITVVPIVITSPDHNLEDDEVIRITGLNFLNAAGTAILPTDLNDKLYGIQVLTKDTFSIKKWNFPANQYQDNFTFTPVTTAMYVGGGEITLFPRLNVQTKDFSLFQDKGLQTKISHIDFLMEVTPSTAMSVNLFINSSIAVGGNVQVGNKNMVTSPTNTFYPPNSTSDYAWYSFYATTVGQFFNINITYNDALMNTYSTHQQNWTLLGINAWCRPGGGLTQ